jgi:hypothetical protein
MLVSNSIGPPVAVSSFGFFDGIEFEATVNHLFLKSRLSSLCGLFIYTALAICVFTWGLQYKLSLYDPPQATSHQVPQAKLLSKNEQTGTAQIHSTILKKTIASAGFSGPATPFFIVAMAPILFEKASEYRKQPADSVRGRQSGLSDIFFVRPPPLFL